MSKYKLEQGQRLLQKLSPLQIQYLALLNLPILQLEDKIREELEQNPLLEEGESTSNEEPSNEDIKTEEKNDNLTVEEIIENENNDFYEKRNTFSNETLPDYQIIQNVPLIDDIYDQLSQNNLSETELIIANEILGNLEESGYLNRELILIANDLMLRENIKVTVSEIESILYKIQRCEPRGIGSRSLKECLLIQLEFLKIDEKLKSLAKNIIENEYENFTKKHFELLIFNLKVSKEEIKVAIKIISMLNPKPGEGIQTEQNKYIVPDFIIENRDDELYINLNNRNLPSLKINNEYKKILLDKNKKQTEAKIFVRNKIESAKNFILAIQQRNNTMLSIMGAIVENQKTFFLIGGKLKPLVYADLSKLVRKDKSTISRVVHSKYVQTDFGIYPLRYFFSEGIQSESGEIISNKEVKNYILEIIKNEDHKNPLSDDKILILLKEKGIKLARRTIAKYRELLNIPSARMRRII